jgi:hypothetical protein
MVCGVELCGSLSEVLVSGTTPVELAKCGMHPGLTPWNPLGFHQGYDIQREILPAGSREFPVLPAGRASGRLLLKRRHSEIDGSGICCLENSCSEILDPDCPGQGTRSNRTRQSSSVSTC